VPYYLTIDCLNVFVFYTKCILLLVGWFLRKLVSDKCILLLLLDFWSPFTIVTVGIAILLVLKIR
jgi:hypothetical protein